MSKILTTQRQPRYKIEQLRIDDEKGIAMWNLDAFGAEFGHKIARVFPIFLVFIDGELSAYYYAQPQVCIYPAVHPKLSPRTVYEVGKVLVAATKQVFGNPLWIADEDTPLADPARAKKFGLNFQRVHVFETDE